MSADPQRTRIKICGIKDVATALAAVAAGADMIGLNFVRASPRFIAPEDARKLVDALPVGVEAIGLFCDHSVDDVRDAVKLAGLHSVQLHGREGPGFAKQLPGLKVVKAVGFDAGHMHEKLQPWREARTTLSALLIDTPPSTDATITGGSGVAFDWNALAKLETDDTFHHLPPRILAGGLTAETVGHAIRVVRPYAVDVSSGVESSRGIKDSGMIRAFCEAVHTADAAPAMD